MTTHTRRTLLAAAGAMSVGALAGCSDVDADDGAPEGTILGSISFENLDDDDHTMDLLLQWDGEIIHWTTHELEADGDGITVNRDWPSEPGDFEVVVRLDGDELTQATPAKYNNPDCLSLLVMVDRNGRSSVYVDTDKNPCSANPVESDDATEDSDDSDD